MLDGRVGMNMPVVTRWGSHLKTYKTMLARKEEMENVLRNPAAKKFIHKDLPGILFNPEFWSNLNKLYEVTRPIGEVITELEKRQIYLQCVQEMDGS